MHVHISTGYRKKNPVDSYVVCKGEIRRTSCTGNATTNETNDPSTEEDHFRSNDPFSSSLLYTFEVIGACMNIHKPSVYTREPLCGRYESCQPASRQIIRISSPESSSIIVRSRANVSGLLHHIGSNWGSVMLFQAFIVVAH